MRYAMKALIILSVALGACGDDDGNGDGTIDATVTVDAPSGIDAPPAADAGDEDGAAAAVVVVDCAGVTAAEAVDMQGNAFAPASVTINAGDVVEWTNLDQVPHTVTSGIRGAADAGDLYDSGNMGNGDTYCLRFDEAGAYDYFCSVHPGMAGMVTAN